VGMDDQDWKASHPRTKACSKQLEEPETASEVVHFLFREKLLL
jgi:hypothetical protein